MNVDFFILIENHTNKRVAFGSEPYSLGYYCLELDIRLANGKNLFLKKRKPIWTRNIPEIILIPPHESILYPVTVDRHVWECQGEDDDFPLLGDRVSVRARFMGLVFVENQMFVCGDESSNIGRREVSSDWKTMRLGCAEGDNYLKYKNKDPMIRFRRTR